MPFIKATIPEVYRSSSMNCFIVKISNVIENIFKLFFKRFHLLIKMSYCSCVILRSIIFKRAFKNIFWIFQYAWTISLSILIFSFKIFIIIGLFSNISCFEPFYQFTLKRLVNFSQILWYVLERVVEMIYISGLFMAFWIFKCFF